MAKIFISYSRKNQAALKQVVSLLAAFSTDGIFYDTHNQGGKPWWDNILEQISAATVFVYLVSNESLASYACRAEYLEAMRLGKHIVPIDIADNIDLNYTDPPLAFILSKIHRLKAHESGAIIRAISDGLNRPNPDYYRNPIQNLSAGDISGENVNIGGNQTYNITYVIQQADQPIAEPAAGSAVPVNPPPSTQNRARLALTVGLILLIIGGLVWGIFAFLNQPPPTPDLSEADVLNTRAAFLLTQTALPSSSPTLDPTDDINTRVAALIEAQFVNETATVDAYTDTPAPTPTPTETPLPSETPSATPTPTDTPTATPDASATQVALDAQATEQQATLLAITAEFVTQVAQLTANAPTNTPQPTQTPTPTDIPSATPTNTPQPTLTLSQTPSTTPTNTPTPSITPTPTNTPDATGTRAALLRTAQAEVDATASAQLTITRTPDQPPAQPVAVRTEDIVYVSIPVNSAGINIRTAPSANASVARLTYEGGLFPLLAQETDWYQIGDNQWVSSQVGSLVSGTGYTFEYAPSVLNFNGTNADWMPFEYNFDGVTMVLVPAGCFMMGSEDGDSDEAPVHEQCFDTPFWIDKFEVTQAQFAAFNGVKANPNGFTSDNRPVEHITWFEARDYCEQRRDARLPTEAEWEYAARGVDGLTYPWGDQFIDTNVVYSGNSNNQTANVGRYPTGVSWVGAYDISGNVWEWISSMYVSYPYNYESHEGVEDNNSVRVMRGGSWSNSSSNLRAADRLNGSPDNVSNVRVGFRCARF